MAVKYIAAIKRYSGLSTDPKPTTGVPAGSTFSETDGGHTYTYNGSAWSYIFPLIDGITGALVSVDELHHEIHDGEHFTATFAETIGSGSASALLLETPGSAVAEVHFIADLESSAAGTLIFSETPNATVGTVVIAYNNKRTSGISALTTITSNGAVTTTGTILGNMVVGAGGAGNKVGGESGARNEWILNNDDRYLLQYTSSAASNVAWNVMWYEEEA